MTMENQHAKIMLEIEILRDRQVRNNKILQETQNKMAEKEKEIENLESEYDQKTCLMMRKQRELDIIQKRFAVLKEMFDVNY